MPINKANMEMIQRLDSVAVDSRELMKLSTNFIDMISDCEGLDDFTIRNELQNYLDNSTEEEELTTFFKNEFSSVKSSKIIRDSNGKSKGFGFINLQDFNEYMGLLKLDRPLIFKGQILIIKYVN